MNVTVDCFESMKKMLLFDYQEITAIQTAIQHKETIHYLENKKLPQSPLNQKQVTQ